MHDDDDDDVTGGAYLEHLWSNDGRLDTGEAMLLDETAAGLNPTEVEEAIALIKGAKNADLGRKLIDWASSPAMHGPPIAANVT